MALHHYGNDYCHKRKEKANWATFKEPGYSNKTALQSGRKENREQLCDCFFFFLFFFAPGNLLLLALTCCNSNQAPQWWYCAYAEGWNTTQPTLIKLRLCRVCDSMWSKRAEFVWLITLVWTLRLSLLRILSRNLVFLLKKIRKSLRQYCLRRKGDVTTPWNSTEDSMFPWKFKIEMF